jgi:hypothetical protein
LITPLSPLFWVCAVSGCRFTINLLGGGIKPIKNNMSENKGKLEVGIYHRCSLSVPDKYDDYLVKTNNGTYEFAHFNQDGWKIKGGNGGETNYPIAYTLIPTTSVLD